MFNSLKHRLKNPKSKMTGETPVWKETSHWYFPLGKFQERLEKYVNEMNEKYGWKENVLQYCRGWFNDVLKDRAITRDLDWGVKVPLDDVQNKVLYVWFEAVLGYISATKELSEKRSEPELWKKYWQDEQTKYIAFIGKDNVVFHTIIFPAILMAWNDVNENKYCLPQNVPANEFLNYNHKMRPWYKGAKNTGNLYWTDMYIFFSTREPGITAAHSLTDKNRQFLGVMGVDIKLEALSKFLKTLKISKSGFTFIINCYFPR